MPAIGADRPLLRSSNMVAVSEPVFMLSMTPLIEWTVSSRPQNVPSSPRNTRRPIR